MTATLAQTADAPADFATCLQQHAGIVRKVAATYCRDPHDRADLAQEIVAALWSAWPRYDRGRTFSTWMYQVALNVAISHVRGESRRRRRFEPLDEDHHALGQAPFDHETDQLLDLLHAAIAGLDAMSRALAMLYLDERSHAEIAEILGISESNVGTRIHRLKARIRQHMNAGPQRPQGA